jgi:hypothetical protein
MRSIAALLIFCPLMYAADREQFTLKDGRVIVGTYDETTQTLQIESPKAAMHVDARDIAKREEAPPEAPRVPRAQAAETKPAAHASVDEFTAIADELGKQKERMARASAKQTEAEAELADARAATQEARQRFCFLIVTKGDLELMPLPKDPAAAQAVNDMNGVLLRAQAARVAAKTDKWQPNDGRFRGVFDGQTLQAYAKLKGLPDPYAIDR